MRARASLAFIRNDLANAFARNELAAIYTSLGSTLQKSDFASAAGCQFLERAVKMWAALRAEGRASGQHQADSERAAAALARCRGAR
jgi:hypothetical protein